MLLNQETKDKLTKNKGLETFLIDIIAHHTPTTICAFRIDIITHHTLFTKENRQTHQNIVETHPIQYSKRKKSSY
jgi:hypothetical protein